MPTFELFLNRIYKIAIQSNSAESAARLAEFFIGYGDLSTPRDRETHEFQIEEIEMIHNDTIEVSTLASVD